MRRPLFLFSMAISLSLSVLLSTLLVAGPRQVTGALNAGTPTPFPLPTQVFPISLPQVITLDEEGNVIGMGETSSVEITAVNPIEMGEPITETDHFRFHSKQGYLPIDLVSFTLEAEEVFDYVSARLETTSDTKTTVVFEPPDANTCPSRGSAQYPSDASMPPIITIFADEHTSHAQILGVFAHETAHVLQEIKSEQHGVSPDLALNEGWATWAAGRYWYTWQGTSSFDASVRSYLGRSMYLPLYQNYDLSLAYWGEDCVEKRDILYTEWASFIDFSLATYGTERLETLLYSSLFEQREIDGETVMVWTPADFEGVYGSALNQLEASWLSHLTTQP